MLSSSSAGGRASWRCVDFDWLKANEYATLWLGDVLGLPV
jgi:hypothetical protein